ncbi:unnamed protein product [Meganyctiphanes norvegica]|uniref:Uncharacterized protein n=1 Tax=Meganyctiphanes norvegica TaxID=48144 RepID=A0AAV2S9F7_MEGNR
MLGYYFFTLLVLATTLSSTWSQEYPEGTQDGPCPDIGFRGRGRTFNFQGIWGTWHEQLRMNSSLQSNQCPTTNTYSRTPPDVLDIIGITNPDGSTFDLPREGVVADVTHQRLFTNDHPTPGFPDPAGILFETIYTDYRNLHVFWTCANLEGNKHIPYVWIESRTEKVPKFRLRKTMWMLARKGIDVSRFWKVDSRYCTEE